VKQLGRYLEKALKAEGSKNYPEAIKYLNCVIDVDNKSVIAWQKLGFIYLDLRNYRKAEKSLICALEHEPNSALSYSGLGQVYYESGAFLKAEKMFKHAIELNPNASRHVLLANTFLMQSKEAAAEQSFLNALSMEPLNLEANYNLAILLRTKNPHQAVKLFKTVLDIDANYLAAKRELGFVHGFIGEYRKAKKWLKEAIDQDESDFWSRIYMGELFSEHREPCQAEIHFLKACEIEPSNDYPFEKLAKFYRDNGKEEKALHFEQVANDLRNNI
jgi:tetratricopeptide (TPR) repeat protein